MINLQTAVFMVGVRSAVIQRVYTKGLIQSLYMHYTLISAVLFKHRGKFYLGLDKMH